MKTKKITRENAARLVEELVLRLKAAGGAGLALSELDAADSYIAGLLTMRGRCALVTRDGRQFVVHLKRKARNPPVFREES